MAPSWAVRWGLFALSFPPSAQCGVMLGAPERAGHAWQVGACALCLLSTVPYWGAAERAGEQLFLTSFLTFKRDVFKSENELSMEGCVGAAFVLDGCPFSPFCL